MAPGVTGGYPPRYSVSCIIAKIINKSLKLF